MTQPAEAAPPTPPTNHRQIKGIKEIFRSLSPSPAPDAQKTTDNSKNKNSTGNDTVDTTEGKASTSKKPDVTASATEPEATTSIGTAIAAEWDAVIDDISHDAGKKKEKKNAIFDKLKRLTSKDTKPGKTTPSAAAPDSLEDDTSTPPPPPITTPEPTAPSKQRKNSLELLPGSNTLGRRIQTLLSNVPPFYHTDAAPDESNKPRPPITDTKLLSFLSSTTIMNGVGTSPDGTDTPQAALTIDGAATSSKNVRSVWSVLDRIVPYNQNQEGSPDDIEPETSVMLCAPLVPDESSTVTLAKSKVIEVKPQEEQVQDIDGVLPKVVAKGVFSALWPEKFKLGLNKKSKDSVDGKTPGGPSEKPDSNAGAGGAATNDPKQVKVWIPSKTKLSLQVAWWGYRIWLPPPVLLILDDKTLEAAKRAAMVTAALTWLVNHIPTTGLPPQLAVAVNLLKAVVPLLGYVGGFIAWSWAQVKSFDKGKGVVLSATWLLPIALVPGAWEDPEVPTPEPAPSDPPRSDEPAGEKPVPAPPGDMPGPIEPKIPPEEAKSFKLFGGSDPSSKKKGKEKGKAKA